MTNKEVMQLALDNLIDVRDEDGIDCVEAILKLRAALAQPERAECDGGQCGIGGYCKQCPKTQPEPEPVAWLDSDGFPWSDEGIACRSIKDTYKPLYTAPPQREWVGLTDEDIDAAWKDKLSFSRAIEAKLKEKNG